MSQYSLSEEDIFDQALALPKAERAAYQIQACAGDAGLLRRIEALLEIDGYAVPGSKAADIKAKFVVPPGTVVHQKLKRANGEFYAVD